VRSSRTRKAEGFLSQTWFRVDRRSTSLSSTPRSNPQPPISIAAASEVLKFSAATGAKSTLRGKRRHRGCAKLGAAS
jgi:hypothetical protein